MDTLIKFGKIKNWGLLIGGGLFIAAPITVLAAPTPSVTAPNGCVDWIAKVVSTEGRVETRLTAETAWQTVTLNQTLCPGSMVHTQAHSRAALLLRNNTLLRLTQKSTLTLPAAQPDKPFWLELLDGAINVITRTPKKFQVDTPFVNAAVDGTEFFVKIARAPLPEGGGLNSGQTTVSVFEGRVIAENATGRVTLRGGEVATASVGQAPVTSIPVNPGEQRQAVHWALHYPPILSYRADDFKEGNETSWQARVRKSIAYTQAGDLQNALANVIDTPQDATAAFFGYRASLLLNVGRVNEANADIKTALNIAPNDGVALALQSVIAVAQNQHETALTLSKQSTAQAPQVAGSWMALSYAQQANFNLPEAINAAQHGADNEPDNTLAWARIAELHLMTGNLNGALAAASKASTLNPNLARTQSVLGFAYLTQIKTKHARQAFEQAIMLDQADPLPRLGLGLAKIRDGDLVAGREDIEIATALDPNNALVRSYMGKAYYEEKRDPLAATQFDIAKTLDPKDPTPWFYDAILKQSTNRPVEALQDLQKSIELNDNRAVYRSRLLLDQDLAMHSTSQARTYRELGMNPVAETKAIRSITLDPANYSAHRFLSDSYLGRPRYEIARASEQLQSQLLQPLNMNPVQPRSAATNLSLPSGASPREAAFSEFTPLFTRNDVQLTASALAGSFETRGDELALYGIQDRVSYSLGQYYYETDGIRPHNDVRHDIYSAFAQVQIIQGLDVQLEFRNRKTEQGDMRMAANPNFVSTERRTLEQDVTRLGVHYAPSPTSDFIASLAYSSRTEGLVDTQPLVSTADSDAKGYDAELQYLFRQGVANGVIGGGFYNVEDELLAVATLGSIVIPVIDDIFRTNQYNSYVYTYVPFGDQVMATLGMSYESLESELQKLDTSEFNPKLGLQWEVSQGVRVRAAAFDVTKRELLINQTIEPTQVAGFNQFFDDATGTKARTYALAVGLTRQGGFYAGLEAYWRDLEEPQIVGSAVLTKERDDDTYRAYLYWAPHTRWAFSADYQFEGLRGEISTGFPVMLDTTSVPLGVRYFHPNGLYSSLVTTYVHQQVGYAPTSRVPSSQENFTVVDVALGYRMPRRLGMLSIEAMNLFDQKFQYQDNSFVTSDKFNVNPRYLPVRSVFVKVVLNF